MAWARLAWARLAWARLGWAGLGWAELADLTLQADWAFLVACRGSAGWARRAYLVELVFRVACRGSVASAALAAFPSVSGYCEFATEHRRQTYQASPTSTVPDRPLVLDVPALSRRTILTRRWTAGHNELAHQNLNDFIPLIFRFDADRDHAAVRA